MNHTPEPWHVGGDGTIIYDQDGRPIGNAVTYYGHVSPDCFRANARRIAACVNVCAGVETEQLEQAGEFVITARVSAAGAAVQDMAAQLVSLRNSRDFHGLRVHALREAAQRLVDTLSKADPSPELAAMRELLK